MFDRLGKEMCIMSRCCLAEQSTRSSAVNNERDQSKPLKNRSQVVKGKGAVLDYNKAPLYTSLASRHQNLDGEF